MAQYKIFNGPAPTAASQVADTTHTVITTLLQVQVSATLPARIVEWGISFDGAAAAAGIVCELLECAGAATVTAHATAGIHRHDAAAMHGGDPVTNLILVGTGATGFNATAEGTLTVVRMHDAQIIQPTSQYVLQFPLGREPYMQPGAFFTRIRVKAAAAVNAICYVVVEI